jgi:hypothetical protein
VGLRRVAIFSPPWGVLRGQDGRNQIDEPLAPLQIRAIALELVTLLGQDGVVAIHLPPYPDPLAGIWLAAMKEAKWIPYISQFVIASRPQPLNMTTKYQMKRNSHQYLIFHISGAWPEVSSAFIRRMGEEGEPVTASQVHGSMKMWNTNLSVQDLNVPKAERVFREGGEPLRIQQLCSRSPREVLARFGRIIDTQPRVVVVDIFGGAGSTIMAAKMLDCPVICMDRDEQCVEITTAALEDILATEVDPICKSHLNSHHVVL